ncbi:restriction endonuclease subunit S [Leyella stercorea]|uniref:Restriction endonuclease subunit S n=1 Tax=Leyella stercorea TaxID=363265 RepID=A0A3R6MNX4_9BACT|nr:restriction endonuclease subunit S [Leyella stercorea]
MADIADLYKGTGISKDQLSDDGEPCILYGELYTKYKSETIREVVSKTNIDNTKLVRSKANDVIIPCSGETAEDIATARCVLNGNILLGGDLNIIRLHGYDGAFMSYQLNGRRKYDIAKVAQGVSVVHLYGEHLKGVKTINPCLEEQKKIAKLLSLLDERIATQNKIIDKLQSLIKGLNDTLYAQHGDEVMTSFAELGTSYSGLSGKSAQDFGSGKPFITYLNVYSNNVINENDFQYVAIKDGEKQNVAEYGDVLFTLSSETPEEVGIGSVYLGKEKVYLNSFCFGIHITNAEIAFPPYLSYYVSSTPFRKFVYPYAQGSTRFNLCKAEFEKASIKLPSLESQKRIYSILKSIASKIETEKKLLGLYYTQKQYLLRQMFI